MANTKISQLPDASLPLSGTEQIPVVQTGVTVKTTVADMYAGSDAASFVGYQPAGTGAVATTVQTKLRETVSVKDFGAVGDGVTDDTAAIQAALNTGLPVFVPSGTFKIAGALSYAGKVVIYGNGPTSQLLCDGNILTVASGDYSNISDVYIGNLTAPLTIQRYVETVVTTTADTTSGNNTITVASATGIVVGMTVTGPSVWQQSVVTSVVGTTVTLSKNSPATSTGSAVRFFNVTWNQGAAALATAAQTDSSGRYSPNVNDTDVWSSLSAGQKTLAQIGPTVSISGDHCVVSRIYGKRLSIVFNGGSYCSADGCDFQGGWNWAGIAFLNNVSNKRTVGNKATGNVIKDHGFNGIMFMGCDGPVMSNNVCIGIGETAFKTYQGSSQNGYFDGCTNINSSNNYAYACYQGAFDYQQTLGGSIGFNTATSSSIGDKSSWCMQGHAYTGANWTIDFVSEFTGGNLGPPHYLVVSDSQVRFNLRENNIVPAGYNVIAILGGNNLIHGCRAYQETTRNTGYLCNVGAYVTGVSSETTLVNCDFRDAITNAASTFLFTSGQVRAFNVRANGSADLPIGASNLVQPAFGGTVAIDYSLGNEFYINATTGSAFAISTPTNSPTARVRITITIANTSGGALGSVTWGAGYKLATWTQPASGFNRTITFENNSGGTWYEISRTTSDIPN